MTTTGITGRQVRDGSIYREDINTDTSGKATITKVLAGSNITLQSSGADPGTGDVTISALPAWSEVATTYQALSGDKLFTDTSGGVFTITLPASASVNDTIHFVDIGGAWGTNNLTVARNGHLIDGMSEDLVLDADNEKCSIIYRGVSSGWRVFPEIIPVAGNDWIEKSTSYSAIVGDRILLDSTGGVFTITLPASPSSGDEIWFIDIVGNCGTNNITIARNTNLIMGLAENMLINQNDAHFGLVYVASNSDWRMI